MATPPLLIPVFWGYPRTNSDDDILFLLELTTPRLEKQDVFGNKIERTETASFPVNYRWMADSLLSVENMVWTLGITPCTADVVELYNCVVDPPIWKASKFDVIKTQSRSTVPGYASSDTATSHDPNTYNSESKPSRTLNNQVVRLTTSFNVRTSIQTLSTSTASTSRHTSSRDPISTAKENGYQWLQSTSPRTTSRKTAIISLPKPETSFTVASEQDATHSELTAFRTSYHPLSVARISSTTSAQQQEQGQLSEVSSLRMVLANNLVPHWYRSASDATTAKGDTTLTADHLSLTEEEHVTMERTNGGRKLDTPVTTSQEAATFHSKVSLSSTSTSQPYPIPPEPVSLIPPDHSVLKRGAAADDFFYLSWNRWLAPLIACRFLRRFKDPLSLLNVLLGLLSTIHIPLSAETIRLEFTSIDCKAFNRVCGFGLRKAGVPVRAAEAMLVAIAALVIAIGFLLSRWKSRVSTEPWSIAAIASLLSNAEVRDLLRSFPQCGADGAYFRDDQITSILTGRRYWLGLNIPGTVEHGDEHSPAYGIGICPVVEDNTAIKPMVRDPPVRRATAVPKRRRFWHMKSVITELLIGAITLFFIIGLLILILYHENTVLDTPFERFMDSESFGTIICRFHFLTELAQSQIHHRLAASPQTTRTSVLLSAPSDIFTSLCQFLRSKDDILPFNVAPAARQAEFTPILFSNIPFRNTVMWKMHEECTWLAVAVLSYMILVLVLVAMLYHLGVVVVIVKRSSDEAASGKQHRGHNDERVAVDYCVPSTPAVG
ncbi:hypothetical protein QBC36DRAFT_374634 [Triangularia setosa]|uniref:Uncharacterized protein n=1 Tax=Triangularia setosa TaxID=2587417 RepID=A0AAN7ABB2_9PEZI|nr:hypothetical protein QBC36DRAFT_374634 [Podospora setosa]